MVIPASWPNPYYGDNPPPGWTIYYGDNFTHRLGHISWQHPVVQPDPCWPIRYGRLSTPAGRKIQPNQVHGLVLLHRLALDLCLLGHSAHLTLLDQLSNCLSSRFEKLEAAADLDELISLCRAILDPHPQGHHDHMKSNDDDRHYHTPPTLLTAMTLTDTTTAM